MANNNDMFAAPTPEELDMFKAPSAEELAGSQPKAAPSKLESFLRGGAQGASLGFSDEITAGLESLLTDKKYQDAVKESRANYKSAEEENPLSSLGGNLTGGLASGLATGAALAPLKGLSMLKGLTSAGEAVTALDRLKKAAALGAGMGAVTSAGNSEHAITQEPLALAADSAIGAGLGGAGGAVLSSIGTGIGKAADQARKIGAVDDMFRSFNVGARGTSYFVPKHMEALENESTQAASETRDAIYQKLNSFGQAKKAMLKKAEEEGKSVDVIPLFNKAKMDIEQLTTDEISGADKRKLESVLNAIPGDIDYGNISPEKVDNIKRMFSNYTKFGDNSLQTNEARKIALDMVKGLDEQVLNSVDDNTAKAAIQGMSKDLGADVTDYLSRAQGQGSAVKTMNKGLSDLITTQDLLKQGGSGSNKVDSINEIQKLRGMLSRTASEGSGGAAARQTINETKKVLQNVAPEIADKTIGKAEELAADLHLEKLAKGQVKSGVSNLFGLGTIASVGGSNVAGNVYGSAKSLSTPGSTAFKVLSEYANKGGDTMLGNSLNKIAETVDENRRRAMVNTLMQTPYYRNKIEAIQKKIEGDEDENGRQN